MNTKIFLISFIFLFSSFSFAGKIHKAAKKGDLPTIKKIVAKLILQNHNATYKNLKMKEDMKRSLKEILNSKDMHGNTPLHYAARYGNAETAEFLMKVGADPNTENKDGENAFSLAVLHSPSNMISPLLEYNARFPNKYKHSFPASLHKAVKRKDAEAIKKILADAKKSLLHRAVDRGDTKEIKRILKDKRNKYAPSSPAPKAVQKQKL